MTNYVKTMTFHDKLCQSSDIPEHTMSKQWHSRTNYVTEVTFQNRLWQSGDIPEHTMSKQWHSRTNCHRGDIPEQTMSEQWHSRTVSWHSCTQSFLCVDVLLLLTEVCIVYSIA